jgi:hypothetical protein
MVLCLGAFSARQTLGAEHGCLAATVQADARFRERFPDLLARVRDDIAARADIDTCARVELHLEPDAGIRLLVTLPDGRTASRNVTRTDDIVPTLQALLLVPEPPRAPQPVLPQTTPPPPALQRPGSDEALRVTSPRPLASSRAVGVELSVITSARIGDNQLGYGVGALSFLELQGWLAGFEGRVDAYQPMQGGDRQSVLELGVLAGKRLAFERVALDLVTGPAIAMSGFSIGGSETVAVRQNTAGTPPATTTPASAPPQPPTGASSRWRFAARLGFSPRSVFRTFVGVDGEVGLTQSTDADAGVNPPVARLPNYSIGVGVGATLGTP